jgi:hypothetical protein
LQRLLSGRRWPAQAEPRESELLHAQLDLCDVCHRKIVLHAADGSSSLVQYLPADHSTEWGHHVLNRAVDVQVASRQHISVALILASGGQTQEAACTAHGMLEILQ